MIARWNVFERLFLGQNVSLWTDWTRSLSSRIRDRNRPLVRESFIIVPTCDRLITTRPWIPNSNKYEFNYLVNLAVLKNFFLELIRHFLRSSLCDDYFYEMTHLFIIGFLEKFFSRWADFPKLTNYSLKTRDSQSDRKRRNLKNK